MSVYSLNDVIKECIREHAQVQSISRGLTMDNKESIYKGSMAAMNAWIESRLCKRKVRACKKSPGRKGCRGHVVLRLPSHTAALISVPPATCLKLTTTFPLPSLIFLYNHPIITIIHSPLALIQLYSTLPSSTRTGC